MSDDPTPPADLVGQILFRTVDPTLELGGKPVPALTTLLYRVCDNDPQKYGEATRIAELFIREALNARSRLNPTKSD